MIARGEMGFSTSPCKGEVGAQRREGVKRRFRRLNGAKRASRALRKNLTQAEQLLWKHLRRRQLEGLKFRRQHVIGPWVVDFWCAECRLAIELDGSQHQWLDHIEKDFRRTVWLRKRGITVVRFWNNDVMENLEGVLERIREIALRLKGEATPSPSLPLAGGGGRVSAPLEEGGVR